MGLSSFGKIFGDGGIGLGLEWRIDSAFSRLSIKGANFIVSAAVVGRLYLLIPKLRQRTVFSAVVPWCLFCEHPSVLDQLSSVIHTFTSVEMVIIIT